LLALKPETATPSGIEIVDIEKAGAAAGTLVKIYIPLETDL
jgi:hypothetical protein